MKILKVMGLIAGIAGLIAAGVYLGMIYLDNARLLSAANANKSGNLFNDPMANIFLATGLAAAGGLLLGLGLGLPSRTRGQISREILDKVNDERNAAIANRAAERTAVPEGPEVQA